MSVTRSRQWICMLVLALLPAVVVAASQAARAQTTTPRPVLYRLERTTSYEHGCFPPCACPISYAPVRGTFRLVRTGSNPLFETYAVTDVNWKVMQSGGLRIRGSGTYRIGGEVALQQQLSLDLTVGDQPVQHFDSGLVPGGSGFPRIAIRISIHGEYCLDTVIDVHARPMLLIALGGAGSGAGGQISWEPLAGAGGYDVVQGDLSALRASGGNFTAATRACLSNDTSRTYATSASSPSAGSGLWFLVRDIEAGTPDTYDADDAEQIGTRDPGIQSSPAACP